MVAVGRENKVMNFTYLMYLKLNVLKLTRQLNPNRNLIDLQCLVLQVLNLPVLRVDHVRNPVVAVQETGSFDLDLVADLQGPIALKHLLILRLSLITGFLPQCDIFLFFGYFVRC